MKFVKINDNFEISEGATHELIDDFICKITSIGILRALTPRSTAQSFYKGAIAGAWVPHSIAKAKVKGAIAESYAPLAISIDYQESKA